MADQTFPPNVPTTLATVVKSYLYQQYTDDDALLTFVAAQNYLTQQWVDDFNALNLPVYYALSGPLLDWVAHGLYGIIRPYLATPVTNTGGAGPYDTVEYNTMAYNEGLMIGPTGASYTQVNDDQFKRIITWQVYKGDGWQYTNRWLKRRVHRFLNGSNGYLPMNDNTYDVSVTCHGTAITIDVADSPIARILQLAIIDNILPLPFQYTYNVFIETKTILFGTGTVSVWAGVIRYTLPAQISGAGSVACTAGVVRGTNSAQFSGIASVSVRFTQLLLTASSTIAGTATVQSSLGVLPGSTFASIAGTGGVALGPATLRFGVRCTITGSGSFQVATPVVAKLSSAAINGVGLIQSSPTYLWTTTLIWNDGTGQVGGFWEPHPLTPQVLRAARVTISGTGTVSAHSP